MRKSCPQSTRVVLAQMTTKNPADINHRKTVISLLFWMKSRLVDRFFDEEVNVLTANFLTFPLRELPLLYKEELPPVHQSGLGAEDDQESSQYQPQENNDIRVILDEDVQIS
ncbi:hypothetical protein AVEN_134703-1 [Araneus ventricosus]|uniref:Uncharacterized protein n=1 Tax=Araneus ventricosus TaxID=182803 RepID=A0A4Y2HV07_ARAVE|nr:hypothetical protein AVEN_134703-1 [Araneus ventricosus]